MCAPRLQKQPLICVEQSVPHRQPYNWQLKAIIKKAWYCPIIWDDLYHDQTGRPEYDIHCNTVHVKLTLCGNDFYLLVEWHIWTLTPITSKCLKCSESPSESYFVIILQLLWATSACSQEGIVLLQCFRREVAFTWNITFQLLNSFIICTIL